MIWARASRPGKDAREELARPTPCPSARCFGIAGGPQKPPSVASDAPKLHRLQHVATALTRARKARSPSPWTGRGILEEGGQKRKSESGESDAASPTLRGGYLAR